ncbi:MAG: hypothetical protein LBV73_27445 [Paraburkholderia sp.]|jgi:hypothetical protein|nr:hypothetical protein [Paraburkholderia sp.]
MSLITHEVAYGRYLNSIGEPPEPRYFEVEVHITRRVLVSVKPYQGKADAGVFADHLVIRDQDGTVGSIREVAPQYVEATRARVDEEIEAPRFTETECSKCGQKFGPGDSGFSACSDHAVRHFRITGEGL